MNNELDNKKVDDMEGKFKELFRKYIDSKESMRWKLTVELNTCQTVLSALVIKTYLIFITTL